MEQDENQKYPNLITGKLSKRDLTQGKTKKRKVAFEGLEVPHLGSTS